MAIPSPAMDVEIPYPFFQAPVVHSGNTHILRCGETRIVLDGAAGLSLAVLAENAADPAAAGKAPGQALEELIRLSLRVELARGADKILLDQAFDPSPRLQIISQGASHVFARAFFTLFSSAGRPFGTGTMDIYLYARSLFLLPSLFIDDLDPRLRVTTAGLTAGIPGGQAGLEIRGRKISAAAKPFFEPFGRASDDFYLTVSRPSPSFLRLGWLRNVYPNFLYVREIDKNPEVDELYERWPPWISQRGQPLGWGADPSSGLEAEFSGAGLERVAVLWARNAAQPLPEGGYRAFNGVLGLFWGRDRTEIESLWQCYGRPLKPSMEKGDFRFYNELDGLYEVDTGGSPVMMDLDCRNETADRPFVFRFWNLEGKGGATLRVNDEAVPLTLLNDGGLVEDPMVFIVKDARGPANTAVAAFTVPRGKVSRVVLERAAGMQFTYQMYSDLETYEAWSDLCSDAPLFVFHLREGTIYHARLPGRPDDAFFKLPLYWVKNGVNPATFMNQVRDFRVEANDPREIRFLFAATNLQGSALSTYTCRIPDDPAVLRFEIAAELTPLDDGRRWTSLEYFDLYPFDGVSRRDFHYRDVVYLNRDGVFERLGTGAWDYRFKLREEPERLGSFADYVPRQGPGSKVPHPSDGSVWILGDNPRRGNILFRRGESRLSAGTEMHFTLCNAWVDIHNVLARSGQALRSAERVTLAVEVFGGSLPTLEEFQEMYRKAAGGRAGVRRIDAVVYSREGRIQGFRAADAKSPE
jgi:hypothetical protein